MRITVYPIIIVFYLFISYAWLMYAIVARRHFLRKYKIITGCESRGDLLVPYMTRYTLFECKAFQICIHVFHRSDADDLHDHPWNFVTIPLWRGYLEEVPCSGCGGKGWYAQGDSWGNYEQCECIYCKGYGREPIRVHPLIPYFRKATHTHRVVLHDNKPAVTLVIMGRAVRRWGFWENGQWVWWKRYFKEKGC